MCLLYEYLSFYLFNVENVMNLTIPLDVLRGFCLIFIIKLHNEKMFCCRNIILNIMWNSNKEVIKVDIGISLTILMGLLGLCMVCMVHKVHGMLNA